MAKAGAYLCSVPSLQRGCYPLFEISGDLRRENISLFCRGARLTNLLCCLLFLVRQLIRRIAGFVGNSCLLAYFEILCDLPVKILEDCNIIHALREGACGEESSKRI